MTDAPAPRPGGTEHRSSIPRPAEDQVVVRAGHDQDVVGAAHARSLDVPATLAGALAALGTLLLLSSLAGAVGTIGFQRGVEGQDLSIGGLVAGLLVLLVACVVGGWVASRIARRRGPLHGVIAVLWLVVVAALLAGLAAVAGQDADVRERVGLPGWFSSDAAGTAAVVTGVLALLLMLLGGWLGGRLGDRHRRGTDVELVRTRRKVRTHPGGIAAEEDR